ncbi:MAG: SprT family zinc-dependent metalloprotease [Longimicrobiales bacterium]
MVRELRSRGVTDVQKVRFKANRSRLISLSADRTSLNLHDCFRSAPSDVLDAVGTFARSLRDSPAYRRAIERMRTWHVAQVEGSEQDEPVVGRCSATAEQRHFLAGLYRHLNHTHFESRLPDLIPVRLSDRMSRRLGHVSYTTTHGERAVLEIALNVDLMLDGNERALEDTLLHEMAHAEAWLLHAHRGHGGVWRAIARRVGCEARACSDMHIRRRRWNSDLTRVPKARH